mmetsp:Transcript_60500/g.129819  ORF Transcript_60500/g.129819 Transcript_60500/m.129819 type:complete len:358 (-) Transcript_60500:755-1828(-)
MAPESEVKVDHGPCLHEDHRVRSRPVLGNSYILVRRDDDGLDAGRQRELGVSKDGELIASKNPGVARELAAHEVWLVAGGPEHGEAEERWGAPIGRRARHLARAVGVLLKASLYLLEARIDREALVPRWVLGDASPQHPSDTLVALLARDSCVAWARTRTPYFGVLGQDCLEVLEARTFVEPWVPLRIRVDSCLHRPHHMLVALPVLDIAFDSIVARPLALIQIRSRRCGDRRSFICLLDLTGRLMHGFAYRRLGFVRTNQLFSTARPGTTHFGVLVQVSLKLLERRVLGEAFVPIRMKPDAVSLRPLHVVVARLTNHSGVAMARPGATRIGALVEEFLEVLEAGCGGDVGVQNGVG